MQAGPRSEEVGFAHDSALEGGGFEPSVPRSRKGDFRFANGKRVMPTTTGDLQTMST